MILNVRICRSVLLPLLFLFCVSSFLIAKEKPSLTKKMLKIEPFQQWDDYSCGPTSVMTLLKYYGIESDGKKLASEMGTLSTGTHPASISEWLNNNGFNAEIRENENEDGSRLNILREFVEKEIPILILWVDWGGHWVLLAGYDDKGTEATDDDDVILADPYDRYDGVKDGLISFNAERFDAMWFDAKTFDDVFTGLHIIATPKK
ncbi:MAG: C39 family peptidase [Candidatus Riflebacteria bacterium]|nr:C39 family peptidase [Candidatus Riflebacteria bacterium]